MVFDIKTIFNVEALEQLIKEIKEGDEVIVNARYYSDDYGSLLIDNHEDKIMFTIELDDCMPLCVMLPKDRCRKLSSDINRMCNNQ